MNPDDPKQSVFKKAWDLTRAPPGYWDSHPPTYPEDKFMEWCRERNIMPIEPTDDDEKWKARTIALNTLLYSKPKT